MMVEWPELARYQDGWSSVVVSRDGAVLVFLSSYDDNGRTFTSESRVAVEDFIARGAGPWPCMTSPISATVRCGCSTRCTLSTRPGLNR